MHWDKAWAVLLPAIGLIRTCASVDKFSFIKDCKSRVWKDADYQKDVVTKGLGNYRSRSKSIFCSRIFGIVDETEVL